MMALLTAYKDRILRRNVTIKESDGGVVPYQRNDHVRIRIGYAGQTPKLTVASNEETANGSTITRNSNGIHLMNLVGTDLSFEPGVYSIFVDYFDNADGSIWKLADRHQFVLRTA